MNKMYDSMKNILKECNNNKLDKLVSEDTKNNKPIKCAYMVVDELKTTVNTEVYKNKYINYKIEVVKHINELMTYIENRKLKDKNINQIQSSEVKYITKWLDIILLEYKL